MGTRHTYGGQARHTYGGQARHTYGGQARSLQKTVNWDVGIGLRADPQPQEIFYVRR